MKELVEFIVKRLAEYPDQVRATESEQDGALEVHLTVAEDDKGRVIGKQGKVIKAIRSVAAAAAAKAGKRSHVDVD